MQRVNNGVKANRPRSPVYAVSIKRRRQQHPHRRLTLPGSSKSTTSRQQYFLQTVEELDGCPNITRQHLAFQHHYITLELLTVA